MERILKEKLSRKPGGGLKDRPECEMCGRPVRVSSDDYTRGEILCPACAVEIKASNLYDDSNY